MAINHGSRNQSTATERVINHLLQHNTTSACSFSVFWLAGSHALCWTQAVSLWHIIISTINTTLDVLTESHQMGNEYWDIWGREAMILMSMHVKEKTRFPFYVWAGPQAAPLWFSILPCFDPVIVPSSVDFSLYMHVSCSQLWWMAERWVTSKAW